MEYLVAFQLLCGCFAGYVASHKNRNWFFWFLVGGALPLLGVLAALMVDEPARQEESDASAPRRRTSSGRKLQPPSRCCGSYIPDCKGCPYFRRPLFDRTYSGARKGFCELYDKVLVEEPHESGVKITIEDDESGPG